MDKPVTATPLNPLQLAAVTTFRLFFGTVTGALRLARGTHPEGWRTLRYGLKRDEILDVHSARGEAAAHRPVVFFHGGAWMMGTKDFYAHDLLFLPEAGFPTFNVEYPKAPEHPHPWPLRAVLEALAFVAASEEGGHEVHVAGDSAGGNLAVMAAVLASNPELIVHVDPGFDPRRLPRILSATSIYGVLDRASCLAVSFPGETMIEAYGGPGALGETVTPECAITPMDHTFTAHPPCLLACGEHDPILSSTRTYAARLESGGFPVTTKIYPGATHGYFNFPNGPTKAQSQADLVAFLKRVEGIGA
jgi:acetyl esterase/lipase